MILLFLYFLLSSCVKYEVTFERWNHAQPVFTSLKGDSSFRWNYNAAACRTNNDDFALLVRCQNQKFPSDPYSTTGSVLAWTTMISQPDKESLQFANITTSSVVFEPTAPYENYGTEDPRLTQKDGTYYLLYSAVRQDSHNNVLSQLALATSQEPWNKNNWTRYGPLFPDDGWSKSGSMLIRDEPPHYLIFGDSSGRAGLQTAISSDLIHWKLQAGTILDIRKSNFDSALVEAGPMPLPLTDGNYLFLYNSARHGYPSVKPNWDMQYNVGYAILDKRNPLSVINRSENPLFSPVEAWETGNKGKGNLDLTPNVVFVEGWQPIGPNKFLVFYGAADSVIGVGLVQVNIAQP